jgi:CheY-like chemotaxis protein
MEYTALVVDDNELTRDLMRIALDTAGYSVSEARNGREALEVLETQTYRLLVLDLQMPQIDGAAVLKWLREHPLHQQMIVVVATANAHMVTNEVERADYVIYKPLDVTDFIRLVQRLKDPSM